MQHERPIRRLVDGPAARAPPLYFAASPAGHRAAPPRIIAVRPSGAPLALRPGSAAPPLRSRAASVGAGSVIRVGCRGGGLGGRGGRLRALRVQCPSDSDSDASPICLLCAPLGEERCRLGERGRERGRERSLAPGQTRTPKSVHQLEQWNRDVQVKSENPVSATLTGSVKHNTQAGMDEGRQRFSAPCRNQTRAFRLTATGRNH